ncbi:MAG TPA: hypothetical protein VFE42_32265 [Chloroflexota bacterium]|nr:hypothetical protein [Chloroflexota bacterium]
MSEIQPHNNQQGDDRGELRDAVQALVARLSEVLTGPEAQRVKAEIEASAHDLIRHVDYALEGPAAQAVKDRVAALLRTIQQHLK